MPLNIPNVNASEASSTSVNVSWNAISGATQYDIFRDGDYLRTITGNTSFVDENLNSGTTYRYAVTATNGTEISTRSSEASITLGSSSGGGTNPPDFGSGSIPFDQKTNVTATAVSSSSVRVDWQAVDQAEKYNLHRDGEYVTTITGKLTYTHTGLSAGTYSYRITAIDDDVTGVGRFGPSSDPAIVTVGSSSGGGTNPPDNPPDDRSSGGGSVDAPNVNDGIDWRLVWNDEFEGNSLDTSKWRIEPLTADEFGNSSQRRNHQPGVKGFDRNGNITRNDKGELSGDAEGKRWAMWYDDHHERTINVGGGRLSMGAYASNETDPTIKSSHHPYTNPRQGATADFRNKLFTGWIDTFALTYDNVADNGQHIPNPQTPNFCFRYGFIEFGVNFSQVRTDGLRISGWLLPAVDPANPNIALNGTTYNDGVYVNDVHIPHDFNTAADGLEVDVWEYEYTQTSQQLLLCKSIGAGAAKPQAVDCADFDIDISTGDHTIAVKWTPTELVWYVDGIQVFRDFDQNTQGAIPRIANSIYITREGNSGANYDKPQNIEPDPPYIQKDAGLWGWNVGTEPDSKINADEAYINYVRVYQDPNQSGNWMPPEWANGQGIDGDDPTDTDQPDAPDDDDNVFNPPDDDNNNSDNSVSNGSTSGSVPISTAPNISLTQSSTTSILFEWQAVNNASRYNLSRDGAFLRTSIDGLTSFLDTGLVAGRTYSYNVQSIDDDLEDDSRFGVRSTTLSLTLGGSSGGGNPPDDDDDDPFNPPDDPPDNPFNPPDDGANPVPQQTGTGARNIIVRVTPKDRLGALGPSYEEVFNNLPPPQLQRFEVAAGAESVIFSFDPLEGDVEGYRIRMSRFSDMRDSVVIWEGRQNTGSFGVVEDAATDLYFQAGAFDKFGRDEDDINYSNTQQVTTILGDTTEDYLFSGIVFSGNDPSTDRISWSAGEVLVSGSLGTSLNRDISAGSGTYNGSPLFIYYIRGNNNLSTTTNPVNANIPNSRVVAIYRGNRDIASTDGTQPLISGNILISGTVGASQLFAGELITQTAQIASGLIQNVHIQNGSIDSAKIGHLAVDTVNIKNGSITDIKFFDLDHLDNPNDAFIHGSGWLVNPDDNNYIVPTTGDTAEIMINLQQTFAMQFHKNNNFVGPRIPTPLPVQIQYQFQTPKRTVTQMYNSSDNEFGSFTEWRNIVMGTVYIDDGVANPGVSFAGAASVKIPPSSQIKFRFDPDFLYGLKRFSDSVQPRWNRIDVFRPRLIATAVLK